MSKIKHQVREVKIVQHLGQSVTIYVLKRNTYGASIGLNRKNEIELRVHPAVKNSDLNDFMSKYLSKIIEKQSQKAVSSKNIVSESKIFLFGKSMELRKVVGKRFKVDEFADWIYLTYPSNVDFNVAYKKMMLHLAKNYIPKRTDEIASVMKISNINLKFRQMQTRWGVCNTIKRTITINPDIMRHSKKTIDYLIVHELVHLTHPNHSTTFWNVVKQHISDYALLRKQLNY